MIQQEPSFKNPLLTPVQYVKGVGPYISRLLEKKGVQSALDLLYYFPIRYVDRRTIDTIRSLKPGKEKCVVAEVVGMASRPLPRQRRKIFEMLLKDQTGIVLVVWFHFNEKFLIKKYPVGSTLLISGECQFYRDHKQFVHPDIEEWDSDSQNSNLPIVPVYPLTEGLYQKTIRKICFHCVESYLHLLDDAPLSVRADGSTKVSLKEALNAIHCPPKEASIHELINMNSIWHQRVIYDELFFLQLGLGLRKQGLKKDKAHTFVSHSKKIFQAMQLLPFQLTGAQKRVLQEIQSDLEKCEPMNRLLQGDVGCGKTLVAFMAALMAAESGCQTSFMVPTEVLAKQHYANLKPLADQLDIHLRLLTRTTPRDEREKIVDDLRSGHIHIVVGTHALIQDDISFHKLGLIIIDEQHRFGVMQRASLKDKGHTRTSAGQNITPHILVMTATPIPRTLSMGVYGDLDISVIDELPKGRKPVTTYVYNEKMRTKAYELILNELKKGCQVYFVYPLIEESEKVDLKNAVAMADSLQEVFKEYRVGLMHGKMKTDEKEAVMDEFKKNKIHILVSTTVIEVGVDVPNSTVMVVEHAERFGLSQLHQLRGRVGRGADQSFCLLIAGYARSEETRYRLRVMEQTQDGFKIAEEDLQIRGPGDFLGTRQSGLPEFRLAHLVRDAHLLNAARKRALEIIAEDPDLTLEKHESLKRVLRQRWEGKLKLASVS